MDQGVQTDLPDAQKAWDMQVKLLTDAISGKGQPLKVELKKPLDPYAYQKRLMSAQSWQYKTMENGRYYHDLAFRREIQPEHFYTHSIRYS